jgi:hypothetical protein
MATAARRHDPAAQPRSTTDDRQTAADAAVATWREIGDTLSSVIGVHGFAALYLRCIELRSRQDPRLQDAQRGVSREDRFAALHAALSRRPRAEAEDAQRELLLTFHHKLGSLLGAPLAARLLSSAHPSEP